MDLNHTFDGYYQRVNSTLTCLIDKLPLQHSSLLSAMGYGALLGGKRLRPFLVYATGDMLQAPAHALDAAAAAIECIHAYSLIHDDLPAMDNADLRRGQPTCHVKFGESIAILAGDALQTLAFSILADEAILGVTPQDRIAMIAELAHACGVAGMCGGQALDLAAEGQHIDLATLERIHCYKTGALIRAAVRLGAFTAGERGRQALSALDDYANAIGLAFQVQDDILDAIGDTTVLGKRQGTDRDLGKSTYTALMGLEKAQQKAQSLYQQSLHALEALNKQCLDTTALQALAGFIIKRDK